MKPELRQILEPIWLKGWADGVKGRNNTSNTRIPEAISAILTLISEKLPKVEFERFSEGGVGYDEYREQFIAGADYMAEQVRKALLEEL